MMHNTLFVYALLNEKEIRLWEKNDFKCVGISTPHICKEQQYRYLQEGNLIDKVHLFDFSFNLFEVEEPEQQSITLRRLKILLANMGISLNLLSLREAEKILQDPAILLMAERQRFGYKRIVDISYRIYIVANFWHSYLREKKIERVVFGEIPHHVDDYVLLQLTKIMGIKTVCIQCGILSKTFITNANLETIEGNNFNDLEELKDILRETAENLKDWSKYLPAVDASKGYKPKTGITKNYKELLKEGLHEDFIEIGGNYLGEMKNSSEIFEEEKKYILYLLHMEPESAVYPMSTKCISQSSVLDILSILFPEHQIVIKEHPHMYSKEVEKLIPWRTEHLSLVREEINTIIRDNKCMMWSSPTKETEELLANADALVCLNGSTGLMGLLSGIPTFVAKGSYLSGCNGTENIDECNNIELEELKKRINNNKEGRIEEIALHLSKRLYKSHLITLHEKSLDEITSQDLITNIKKAMEKV